MHSASFGEYPDYDILIADDASKFIVHDTEGRANANGKWDDSVDGVDYRFVHAFGPAYVFESVVVHRHPDDGENDCASYQLGPGDENVLADDLPGDVEALVRTEMGVAIGSPVAAIDMTDPENSRVAGTPDAGEESTPDPLDPEEAVEIDIDAGGGDDV